jgi:hypothetical protein
MRINTGLCLTIRRSRDSGTTRPRRVYQGDNGGNRASSDGLRRQKHCAARRHFDSPNLGHICEKKRVNINERVDGLGPAAYRHSHTREGNHANYRSI